MIAEPSRGGIGNQVEGGQHQVDDAQVLAKLEEVRVLGVLNDLTERVEARRDRETTDEQTNRREDDVDGRTGEGDPDGLLTRFAQSRQVDRHGLGVAKGWKVDQEQERGHQDRAKGVDVR